MVVHEWLDKHMKMRDVDLDDYHALDLDGEAIESSTHMTWLGAHWKVNLVLTRCSQCLK